MQFTSDQKTNKAKKLVSALKERGIKASMKVEGEYISVTYRIDDRQWKYWAIAPTAFGGIKPAKKIQRVWATSTGRWVQNFLGETVPVMAWACEETDTSIVGDNEIEEYCWDRAKCRL